MGSPSGQHELPSQVMESSELVSQSAFSSRAVVSPGAFLRKPEYDLNCLFDLKSPDDFGPWKRWPEFAKFFLYHGGPTLKNIFVQKIGLKRLLSRKTNSKS
jgi:hypothetical protein